MTEGSEKTFKGRTSIVTIKGSYAIKAYREKTKRKNFEKEYLILKAIEGYRIAPKGLKLAKDHIVLEYIEGKPLKDFYDSKEFPKILMLLVVRAAILDLLRINHNQLAYGRNVIVDKNNVPWIIDFEKASVFSKTMGKNVCQVLGFYSKFLDEKTKRKLVNLSKEWKKLLKSLYK